MSALAQLNEEQREAAGCLEPNVVLLAGPGSGKTRTLVHRIRYLIEDLQHDPQTIVAITFTNAAANEIQQRLAQHDPRSVERIRPIQDENQNRRTGTVETERIASRPLGHAGTLHSFALRMLREHGTAAGYGDRTTVISPESAQEILEAQARRFKTRTSIDCLLELKNRHGLEAPKPRHTLDETVILSYLEEMRVAGIVDFDAILAEFLRLLNCSASARQAIADRFSFLHVDEAQDGSPMDWEIYRWLPIAHKFYVGDADQSLYKFRGAEPRCFLNAARSTGTRMLTLATNYRSLSAITKAADRLIAHNELRIPKRMIPARGDGGAVVFDVPAQHEGEEIARVAACLKIEMADGTPPTEIAILTRTNALAAAYRRTLAAWDLPIAQAARSDLPADWPALRACIEHAAQPENDVAAYLWLVADGLRRGHQRSEAVGIADRERRTAAQAGKSIARNQPSFMLPGSLDDLPAIDHLKFSAESRMLLNQIRATLRPGATILDLALAMAQPEAPSSPQTTGIEILTVHASKGREFAVVLIAGLEDEMWPGRQKDTDIEESRRCMFVAVTRAKDRLYLYHAASRVLKFGKFEKIENRTPSRFLKELQWPLPQT